VGNALQHGAPGSPVRVMVDGTDPASVTLSVANRGTIPPDVRPHIFDPFKGGARRQGEGLGLGLYIAQQIAVAHQGDLAVESNADGTIFCLTVPRRLTEFVRL
jgi:signal transduction histidine kinase